MKIEYNYDLLLKEIDKKYNFSRIELKINKFCQDSKIKVYRFKKILESRTYFQTDEIYRISKILNVEKKNYIKFFFNIYSIKV